MDYKSVDKGGQHNMATTTKPIRPTTMEFKNDEDMARFMNYATSKEKSNSEGIIRAREIMKHHKPAAKRK